MHESFLERGQHVSYLILDFRMVEEVDTTAVKKIKKLLRYTESYNVITIITNLTTKMRVSTASDAICECTRTVSQASESPNRPGCVAVYIHVHAQH